jgi:hypothetical protein
MTSSVMWCRVGLVITDVSEESVALIFRVGGINERGKTLVLTSKVNYTAKNN